jgi:hypothetical protein
MTMLWLIAAPKAQPAAGGTYTMADHATTSHLRRTHLHARRSRGDCEIGMQTEDGAVVACVCIWDGTGIDQRSESEREEVALEKATRLAHAFSAAVR